MQHIKDQNWFAVGLDVLVVIVGIFLGMQVTEWNEERNNEIEEREILAKLFSESKNALNFISAQSNQFEKQVDGLEALVKYLYSDQPLPEDTSDFLLGFQTVLFYPQLKPVKSVYTEVSSSGRLSLIQDDDVRIALSSYYASLEAYDSQLTYFRQFTNQSTSNPFNYLRGEVKYKYDLASPTRRKVLVDYVAIRGNQDLVNALLTSLRHQRNFHYHNRLRVLQYAEELCVAIANTLNDECKGRDLEKSNDT